MPSSQEQPPLRLIDRVRLDKMQRRGADADACARFIAAARERSLAPRAEKLRCDYPPELPITPYLPEISATLRTSPVVIVCGATGSGKTTQLPKAALAAGFGRCGRIGCTQPRRIAATALARRFASETGVALGEEVGCKIRFEDRTGDATVVKFMTDGILLAETRSDPELLAYDCLLIDEVHERSLNIDFLLGYLKHLLETRRPELRVIISSATMESERLAEFFGGAPVINIPGGLHPVEDCFLEPDEDEDLSEAIARGVEFLSDFDPRGDTLVFLPGEREIRDAAELLRGRAYPATEVLALYGRLGSAEQDRIFHLSPRTRRIILATNVAETSLTIPGIKFVIDTGLVRISRYNPRTRIQELRIEFVSQASARQRRGRCGRLSDGICLHLYSEAALTESAPYTAPEIQRSSLAGVILQMAALRLPPVETFPFVDPPSPAQIREGRAVLDDLHAIRFDGRLTPIGRKLAALPLDPHLGKMLVEGAESGLLGIIAVIAAGLSIADPRERPFEQARAADEAQKKFLSPESDFFGMLNLWRQAAEQSRISNSALRAFARKNFLSFRRLREWRGLVSELLDACGSTESADSIVVDNAPQHFEAIHQILLGAMPRQLAAYDPEKLCYSDMGGRKFTIFPGSGLAKRRNPPRWLLFFALVETTRLFGRCVAEARPEWLPQCAPHLCKSVFDQIHYDPASGFVRARERITAGSLLIHPGRRRDYSGCDPAECRRVFIVEALAGGALASGAGIPWLEEFIRLRSRLEQLEIKLRRPGSVLDENAIITHFEAVLPAGANSLHALKLDWKRHHRSYLPEAGAIADPELLAREEDFPDHITRDGLEVKVKYSFSPGETGDGITVEIPESAANYLGTELFDYLTPGYLEWKIEFMLRSLPKPQRRQLLPLGERVSEFLSLLRQDSSATAQPLSEALVDFLRTRCQLSDLRADAFDRLEYPEYLRLKLALTDERGRIVKVLDAPPNPGERGSRLAGGFAVAAAWQGSGFTSWPPQPPERWPESVEVIRGGERTAAIALCDEGNSVGRNLYLDQAEAELQHAAGIIRLYQLRYPQQIKYLKGSLRLDHVRELELFSRYPQWRSDLVATAIGSAFKRALWEIRSSGEFERESQAACDRLSHGIGAELENIVNLADRAATIRKLIRKLPKHSFSATDAAGQLDYLFRPGFLRCAAAASEYPRYLRGLNLRLERAIASPARDEAKGETLEPFIRRFTAAAETTDPAAKPGFLKFFLLLEESRLAIFSPEVRARGKAGIPALAAAWEELRL